MIQIRKTVPADYPETERVMREAFWNHYVPGCCEHYLVHIMRDAPSYIPELDFVAVDGGRIIGNILYLSSKIIGDDGMSYDVLSLGPIAVLPEYQGKGVGRELISHTRNIARTMGFHGILLCGDPDYYTHCGFSPAEVFGIRNAEDMYADALHACELYSDSLAKAQGRYVEDAIYAEAEHMPAEFDAQFPTKALVTGTPMQRKFAEMVGKVRPHNTS